MAQLNFPSSNCSFVRWTIRNDYFIDLNFKSALRWFKSDGTKAALRDREREGGGRKERNFACWNLYRCQTIFGWMKIISMLLHSSRAQPKHTANKLLILMCNIKMKRARIKLACMTDNHKWIMSFCSVRFGFVCKISSTDSPHSVFIEFRAPMITTNLKRGERVTHRNAHTKPELKDPMNEIPNESENKWMSKVPGKYLSAPLKQTPKNNYNGNTKTPSGPKMPK